ncbi:MAG TPA: amidohydrolase family protein [Candidatus Binataceae bacterium]|nr:amidohydrolase family protein [Candidatus Binataceae bacterium]
MARIEENIHKPKYPGAVDADGHIYEAGDLWEQYAEAKYRTIAVRMKRDDREGDYLEIQGRPSKIARHGVFSQSVMGRVSREHGDLHSTRPYGEDFPLGSMDARERVERLDREGLHSAFIYPTIGLNWETECDDIDYAQAMCRAYNRWLIDWCSEGGKRLVPVAHLSLGDPKAAAEELERAVKAGCKGGWVVQFTMTRKPHAHPDHDVLFAKAQELDVPIALHVSLEPPWALPGRYALDHVRKLTFFQNVTASDANRHALASFMQYGTFDKFPKLKIAVLEVGAGWTSYWLDRMDAVYDSIMGRSVPLKEKPSHYFRRNVFVSADPDEHALPAMMDLCGDDRFFWASDFPHPDHTGNYIDELEEIAEKLQPSSRQKLLSQNVEKAYNLNL